MQCLLALIKIYEILYIFICDKYYKTPWYTMVGNREILYHGHVIQYSFQKHCPLTVAMTALSLVRLHAQQGQPLHAHPVELCCAWKQGEASVCFQV